MNNLKFTIERTDGNARTGLLQINGQKVKTPAIVNIGDELTRLSSQQVRQTGTKIIKTNGLSWWLKYGSDLTKVGDLHHLYHWSGLLLVDIQTNYAYQLAKPRGKKKDGVHFHEPSTGQLKFWTPATALNVQQSLGADLLQSFDRATDYYAPVDDLVTGVEQTSTWLSVNKDVSGLTLGAVNGGGLKKFRQQSVQAVTNSGLAGYQINEVPPTLTAQEFSRIINEIIPMLQVEQLRYLASPVTYHQLLAAVLAGFDLIDSSLAVNKAAMGIALVGKKLTSLHLDRQHFSFDQQVIDPECTCPVCQAGYSRALIHSLIVNDSLYGKQLLLQHNLFVLNKLITNIQQTISKGQIKSFIQELA